MKKPTGIGLGSKTNEESFELTKNKHRDPTLDSFPLKEGIHEELKVTVAKEAIIWQLQQPMKIQQIITKNRPN